MSITRRRFLKGAAGVAGGVLAHSVGVLDAAWAAGCTKAYALKNCSSVQPSVCLAGTHCTTRWSNPSTRGGSSKTIVAYSPNSDYYAQCQCWAGQNCICQIQVCVCNGGMCACKLWCDCIS